MRRSESSAVPLLLALGACASASFTTTAQAQSGTDAMTAQFNTICAGAASGSALAARCAVVLASGNPNARAIAADHNDLEEIPGAGRGDARDQWPSREEVSTLLTPKLAVFASVDHARSFRNKDTIEAAFDADATTFTAGIDWHPAKRWQIGLALNHAHDNQVFRGSEGRTDANTTGAIAVGSWDANDHFVLDGYIGRTQGSQDIRRVVSFVDGSAPVAESASPGLHGTLGGVAVDASFPHGSLEWRGSFGFDEAHTSIDGYIEQGGSGFDLIVPHRKIDTDRGRIDVALAGTFSESWGVWQPEFRVGLRHEFGNDAHNVGVRFVDDTNGTVVSFDTGAPDRDWVQAGLSAAFTFTHGQSAFATIGREFGHSTSTATTYAIGWRIEL
ncbi:MAG TPA: autotransporter outer membrane beta-barrel domain-containing protein [Xanthomonadaceae bacterium]|nr:autotransporter outer membrane beta-barrel domain-containing protein [Xanthomonadaceae bacterium]